MFDTVGLIGKHGDDRVARTLEQLVAYLSRQPVRVLFDDESAEALPTFGLEVVRREDLGPRCDLVIIVGGDGTFLHAARSLVNHNVPLVGINLGRLGFLTDVMPSEMTETLDQVFAGKGEEERRFLLNACVIRDGETVVTATALNDVVAHKRNIARLIEFQTYVDSRLLSSQRSDGLIVSTPTGSTAYALSGGGPIIHPALETIVLVPICPHTLSSRPMVVGGNSLIEIVMGNGQQPSAELTCDGQTGVELVAGDRVQIRVHERRLRLIHPPGYDYFTTLRTKLHWDWGRGGL